LISKADTLLKTFPTEAEDNIYGIIFSGFQISKIHYLKYADLMKSIFPKIEIIMIEDDEGDQFSQNIAEETKQTVDRILKLNRKSDGKYIVVGHSRGGAVAINFINELHQADRSRMMQFVALILLDPVDDDKHFTTNKISALNVDTRNVTNQFSSVNYPPILFVSTPFGGKSSYYKTEYTSVCAPPGNNE
jgi:thioesterase domain-containing protein